MFLSHRRAHKAKPLLSVVAAPWSSPVQVQRFAGGAERLWKSGCSLGWFGQGPGRADDLFHQAIAPGYAEEKQRELEEVCRWFHGCLQRCAASDY